VFCHLLAERRESEVDLQGLCEVIDGFSKFSSRTASRARQVKRCGNQCYVHVGAATGGCQRQHLLDTERAFISWYIDFNTYSASDIIS